MVSLEWFDSGIVCIIVLSSDFSFPSKKSHLISALKYPDSSTSSLSMSRNFSLSWWRMYPEKDHVKLYKKRLWQWSAVCQGILMQNRDHQNHWHRSLTSRSFIHPERHWRIHRIPKLLLKTWPDWSQSWFYKFLCVLTSKI